MSTNTRLSQNTVDIFGTVGTIGFRGRFSEINSQAYTASSELNRIGQEYWQVNTSIDGKPHRVLGIISKGKVCTIHHLLDGLVTLKMVQQWDPLMVILTNETNVSLKTLSRYVEQCFPRLE